MESWLELTSSLLTKADGRKRREQLSTNDPNPSKTV